MLLLWSKVCSKFEYSIAITAVLLLITPAVARAGWNTGPDAAGSQATSLAPTIPLKVVYYDFNDTTDSPILARGLCSSISVDFDQDPAGDGAVPGAEILVYGCATATASTTRCKIVAGDADGDGIPGTDVDKALTIDGVTELRGGLDNITYPFIFIHIDSNSGSDEARVAASCVQ